MAGHLGATVDECQTGPCTTVPLTTSSGPGGSVGACLLRFTPQWNAITEDSWVRNVVARGYILPFKSQPPLSISPVDIQLPGDTDKCRILDTEILTMSQKQAIEPVTQPLSPGFYSHIFLVPKKNGKWRPVIDLSSLNVHIRCPTFRMETSALVMAALQQGEWATSLDLSDAYFHIPIHTVSRRYLRFKHRGCVYQFRALPFGLNTAPRVFTRMMSVVMAFLRSTYDVVIHPYIDDWLIRASSESESRRVTDIVLRQCTVLGLNVNLAKSDLTPSQQFSFLGNRFDLQKAWVWPGDHKVQALQVAVQVLLDTPVPHARLFLKALGHGFGHGLGAMGTYSPEGDTMVLGKPVAHGDGWSNRTSSGGQALPGRPALVAFSLRGHSRGTPSPPHSNLSCLHGRVRGGVGGTVSESHDFRGVERGRDCLVQQSQGATGYTASHTGLGASPSREDSPSGHEQHHGYSLYKQARGFTLPPPARHSARALPLVSGVTNLGSGPSHTGEGHSGGRYTQPSRTGLSPGMEDRAISPTGSLCLVGGKPMVDVFATSLNTQLPLYYSPVRSGSSSSRQPQPELAGSVSICIPAVRSPSQKYWRRGDGLRG